MPSPTPSAPVADPVGRLPDIPHNAAVCLTCLGTTRHASRSYDEPRRPCGACGGEGWVSR